MKDNLLTPQIRCWCARKTLDQLNARVDERLLETGPPAFRPGMVFLRRWIQPLVIDCTKISERIFRDEDWHGLIFVTRKFEIEGMPVETTFAIPRPEFWEWREEDRLLCNQMYNNIRTVDILIDDVVRACNTELQLLSDSNRYRVQDIRLFTDDERQERVDKIKSVTEDYWYQDPWKPGRYPQCSVEDEARRQIQREIEAQRNLNRETERGKEVIL